MDDEFKKTPRCGVCLRAYPGEIEPSTAQINTLPAWAQAYIAYLVEMARPPLVIVAPSPDPLAAIIGASAVRPVSQEAKKTPPSSPMSSGK